jgi:ATP-dependent Clp protease adapter protein ClpS
MQGLIWYRDTTGYTQTRQDDVRVVEGESAREPELERLWRLVLFNDDLNGFGYVVGVLARVLGCGRARAFWLTLKVHTLGQGTLATGALADMNGKAEQIRATGPDPNKAGARPLVVAVEPLAP